jgi:hypothetical protein
LSARLSRTRELVQDSSALTRAWELDLFRLSQPRSRRHLRLPADFLSLDTTDRKDLKLYLRDENGNALVRILRTPLPENKDVKAGRDQEVAELKRLDYTLTDIAPELEKNWSNWYALSGVKLGTEFYFRRWYTDDSVVSIEFIYPKEMAPIFEKLVPYMTQDFTYTSTIPKS